MSLYVESHTTIVEEKFHFRSNSLVQKSNKVGISLRKSVPQPPHISRSGISLKSSPTYLTTSKPLFL
jgi:hypothetical protein